VERAERIRLISKRTAGPTRGHPVLFKGRYREFPVTTVPQEALVYRVDNGRLAAELEERATLGGQSLDALRQAFDSAEVQSLLHQLLLAKAQAAEGPIYAELERLGQQTEPLLVTFDGVVVNGNRRLAAMRELMRRDSRRYPFQKPSVAVLPEGTEPREIEFIEIALQMVPETKLAYGWLDRRITLRKQRDVLGLSLEQISAAYRIDDPAALNRELAELALAEEYLEDYCGEPARYSQIADAGDLFTGLSAQISDLSEADRLFWKTVGFVMIDGRAAEPARQSAGSPEKIRDRKAAHPFARLFPFSPPAPLELPISARERLASGFGLRDAAANGADLPSRRATDGLLALFRDRRHSRRTARLIADILDELRLEHNERSAPQRTLQKVREAGQMLSRLEPERLTPEQRRQLRGDLAALHSHAAYLMGEMQEKPMVPGRWTYPKPILRPPYTKIPWRLLRRLGVIPSGRAG
jgi:hypothetical protein